MRIFAGGEQTGALPLAQAADDLLTTQYERSHDSVLKLASSCQLELVAELPENRLVLEMLFSPELGRLLLNVDHSILSWHSEAPKKFDTVTDGAAAPASCLSAGRNRLVFFDPPNLVVHDGHTGERVFETECKPELYGGHTPQLCAALSRDGSVLAVCSQPGELSVVRVDGGQGSGKMNAEFEMIEKLRFDASGELLVGLGQYGPWGPLFFDVRSMSLIDPPIDLPELTQGAIDFAVHPSRRWFAVWESLRRDCGDTDRAYEVDSRR